MADVDIDPFGEHDRTESRLEEPMGENIPLTPAGGGSTWEPEHKQETSFGGLSGMRAWLNSGFVEDKVNGLYEILSEHFTKNQNVIYYNDFESLHGELYFKGRDEPLMRNGRRKPYKSLIRILGKNRIYNLGFDVSEWPLSRKQAVALNKAQEELPSASDTTKADDIELQEIAEKVSKSTEDLIFQIKDVQTDTDDLFKHPLRELLGLDTQLRSIRGSLKAEVAKKVQLEEQIKKEHRKLEEFRYYAGVYDDVMREDIVKQLDALNEELATRQESIDILKGRLKSQIMSFKETIAKVLDKDTSLAEKTQTLFREQGITIASILTAIGMAIGVLIEALLPDGGGASVASGGGEPPPKDEKGLKEWIRSKLKALASLLGKLGIKAAEALLGIIGGIISWILNRAKDVVGWVSQNLWALVVGIGGLMYTYIVTRK